MEVRNDDMAIKRKARKPRISSKNNFDSESFYKVERKGFPVTWKDNSQVVGEFIYGTSEYLDKQQTNSDYRLKVSNLLEEFRREIRLSAFSTRFHERIARIRKQIKRMKRKQK
jgi:hypothetical protein